MAGAGGENLKDQQINNKGSNNCIIGIQHREENECDAGKIFEEKMAEKCQETERTLNITQKKSACRCIIIKLLKLKTRN